MVANESNSTSGKLAKETWLLHFHRKQLTFHQQISGNLDGKGKCGQQHPSPPAYRRGSGWNPCATKPSGCLGPLCWCVTGHLRGPISKATRSGLGRIADVSLQECPELLPQGLTARTTLCQLLLVERNCSRCYINIYHSSFKQHLI